MRILYRNPENRSLAITSVTNAQYSSEDRMLNFFGDDDISISTDKKTADELIRKLFESGMLDISTYECNFYDWDEDDEADEDDDYDDDENIFVIDPGFSFDV